MVNMLNLLMTLIILIILQNLDCFKKGVWNVCSYTDFHNAIGEVQDLEHIQSVTLIASSPETKYQIFKFHEHAYGIQFHIEIKDTTVSDWGCVPEYKSALESQLGKGALEKFDIDAKINMSSMNKYSTILYDNFKKLVW